MRPLHAGSCTMTLPIRFASAILLLLNFSVAAADEPQASEAADDVACCGSGLVTPLRSRVRVTGGERVLRISADPNNLPFTNDKLEGFENKIAEVIARELGADIEYIWRAQRRGFFRQSLKEGECDLVLGAPVGFDLALTTKPYYR